MDKKQPYRIVASGKKAERRDYSKVSGHLELPNLVESRQTPSSGSRTKELGKFSMRFTRFKTMEEISS